MCSVAVGSITVVYAYTFNLAKFRSNLNSNTVFNKCVIYEIKQKGQLASI